MASTQNTGEGRSIGTLVSNVTNDLQTLVRGEIELAKVELKKDVSRGIKGGVEFAIAGVLALYALGLLFLGAAWVIAIWLPVWAGLLIMAGFLFLVAGLLGLMGYLAVNKISGKPEKTIATSQAAVQAIKPTPEKYAAPGVLETRQVTPADAPPHTIRRRVEH